MDGSAAVPRPGRLVARFLGRATVGFGILWGLTFVPAYASVVQGGLLRAYGWATSVLLDLFGVIHDRHGATLADDAFAMEVRAGCDAYGPCALLVACILAFPAAGRRRTRGLVAGLGCLVALNLVRLVSLFLVGRRDSEWFELLHVEIWQPVFVLAAGCLFLAWARRVPREELA